MEAVRYTAGRYWSNDVGSKTSLDPSDSCCLTRTCQEEPRTSLTEVFPGGGRRTLKVFISWSGDVSRKLATVLSSWVPMVIQEISTYVSSQDTPMGEQWPERIRDELQDSSFAILCMTPENLKSHWIHFEAGAAFKALPTNRVCPLLFEVRIDELERPLSDFQAAKATRDDIFRIMESLNESCERPISARTLERSFDAFWPQLEQSLAPLREKHYGTESPRIDTSPERVVGMLEEILQREREEARTLGYIHKLSLRSLLDLQQTRRNVLENSVRHLDDGQRFAELQATWMALAHNSEPQDHASIADGLAKAIAAQTTGPGASLDRRHVSTRRDRGGPNSPK